jgi:hypothetical protein
VKKLILAVMLSVLLLGFGSAMAATSAMDNLPGGAGVIYWQANATWQTLVDIQSIDPMNNTTIHVVIYDMNSIDVLDFELPFTPLDHVGFAITCDGVAACVAMPYSDNAFGGGLPPAGQPFGAPAIDGMQYGYIGLVHDVTVAPPADPTIAPSNTRTNYLPGWEVVPINTPALDDFIMRAALIQGTTNAYGANATMLQGFANMVDPNIVPPTNVGLNEAGATSQFIDSTVPAACAAINWNGDAVVGNTFLTNDDAGRGPEIDSWELYATENFFMAAPPIIPMLVTDGCVRAGRAKSLGSWNNLYWGRYNATPGLTTSTLVMVFPASPGMAAGTADPRGPGSVTVHAYNDDEAWVSTGITPDEVHTIVAGSPPGFNINNTAGELQIDTATPMYGWVVTETAGFVDVYPLYRERGTFVTGNLVDQVTLALIPIAGGGISDVVLVP